MDRTTGRVTDSVHQILVISPDAGLAAAAKTFLDGPAIGMLVVSEGEDATALCKDKRIDLAIIDYRWRPETIHELLDGLSALQVHCRFIVLNAPRETHQELRNRYPRIVAALPDPFNPEVLGYYLRTALNFRDSRQNRRNHHRYTFNVEIHCATINPFSNSSSRPHPALMREISRSGASMIIRELVPVPAILKLAVQLPHQVHPIQILAKSVSCTMTQIPGVFRLGAKFLGLLPPDLAQSIGMINRQHGHHDSADIYMGKSFKEALHDWIANNRTELDKEWPEMDLSINELADALGSNDESEAIECEEDVLRAQADADNLFSIIEDEAVQPG